MFEKGNKHGNRFQPGESGNPKGRQKKDKVDRVIDEVFTEDQLVALAKLGLEKMLENKDEFDPNYFYRMFKLITDRLGGKAHQSIEVEEKRSIIETLELVEDEKAEDKE